METDISGLFYCPRQQQVYGNNRVLKGRTSAARRGLLSKPAFHSLNHQGTGGLLLCATLWLLASMRPGGRWSPRADASAISHSLRNACGRSGEAVSTGQQPHRSWPEPHGAAGRGFAEHPCSSGRLFLEAEVGTPPRPQ